MSAIAGIRGYAALVERAASSRPSQADALASKAAAKTEFAPVRSSQASPVATAMNNVVEAGQNADKLVIDLASGRDVSVADTMVELEKADIALKYAVQLRNRALAAYEELMRIQI